MFFLRCFFFVSQGKRVIFEIFFGGELKKIKTCCEVTTRVLGSHVHTDLWWSENRQETQMNTLQFARSHLRYVLCLMWYLLAQRIGTLSGIFTDILPFKKSSIQTKNVGKYTIDGDPMGYGMARFSVLFLLWLFYRAIQQFGIETPKLRTSMYTFQILIPHT